MRGSNLKYISEMVDEIAIDKPLDWTSVNYESMKEVSIHGAIEHYLNINNNDELSREEKDLMFVSLLAYLILENAQLWITTKRGNNNA